VVICLERGAYLHMAQLMPLPLTVSCFSKIQTGFTFLVPAHLVVPEKGPLNMCVFQSASYTEYKLANWQCRHQQNYRTDSADLYSFGMACAAVLRTYGDMSLTDSLMARSMIGTIIETRILERTRRALARIN